MGPEVNITARSLHTQAYAQLGLHKAINDGVAGDPGVSPPPPWVPVSARTKKSSPHKKVPSFPRGARGTPSRRTMSDSSDSGSDAAPPPAVTASGRPARAATGKGDAMKRPVAYTPIKSQAKGEAMSTPAASALTASWRGPSSQKLAI